MNVRVEFYAQLRDVAGVSQIQVDTLPNSTVADLLEEIYRQIPVLREHDKTILVAAGLEFVPRNYGIKSGEVIAVMPPVQGG